MGYGAAAFFGADKIINEFEISNFTKFKNSVLCFDDLARCNIPIEEVMGYINTD